MLYRSVESSDIYGAGSRLFVCLLLVHGVSTAVGHYTVRLTHLSGYKSVATASSKNRAVLKSLGADVVFDVRISSNPHPERSTHNTHVYSTGQTFWQKLKRSLGTPSESPSTVSAPLKVRNSLPRPFALKQAKPSSGLNQTPKLPPSEARFLFNDRRPRCCSSR